MEFANDTERWRRRLWPQQFERTAVDASSAQHRIRAVASASGAQHGVAFSGGPVNQHELSLAEHVQKTAVLFFRRTKPRSPQVPCH
jgi:hypothetical protein